MYRDPSSATRASTWPGIGLLLLILLQGQATRAWLERWPTPPSTLHQDDLTLAQRTAALIEGKPFQDRSAPSTITALGPPGEAARGAARWAALQGAVRNAGPPRSYWTDLPITWLLGALPAAAFGFDANMVRLGPVLVTGLLLLACWALARQVARPWTALAAVVAVSSLTPVWTSARTAFPMNGNMLGVVLALLALLRWGQGAHPAWALIAGGATALASRFGESAGDGLICLAALLGALPLVLAQLGLRGRQAPLRVLVGLLAFALALWLLLDRPWLAQHLQAYVLPEGGLADNDPGGLLARLRTNAGVYPWVLRYSLLGLPGCVLLGLGAAAAVARPSGARLALIGAGCGQLLILSLAAKHHNYYAIAALPPLVIAAVASLGALPRVGPLLAFAGAGMLVPMALQLSSMGASQKVLQSPRPWLGEDTVVRDIAQVPAPPAEIGTWLAVPIQGAGTAQREKAWRRTTQELGPTLEALPPHSLVLLLNDDRNTFDAAAFALATARSDLEVHTWPVAAAYPEWALPLSRAPGHLVVQLGGPGGGPAAPAGLGPLRELTPGSWVKAWQLAP